MKVSIHETDNFMLQEIPHLAWYEVLASYWQWIVGVLVGIGFIWKATRNTSKEAKPILKALKRFMDVATALQTFTDLVNKRFDEIDARSEQQHQEKMALIGLIQSDHHYLQSLLDVIQDSLSTPQWRADEKGNCIDANEAFCELFGKSFEDLEGDGWSSILPQNVRAADLAAWDRSVSKKAKFAQIMYVKTAKGLEKVRLKATPVFDLNGKFRVYLCSVILINED